MALIDDIRALRIADYDYPLPDERIAKHPLAEREQCKLLYYKGGAIEERIFKEVPSLLPEHATLIYNNTRVINARLRFRKQTGSTIEIFCLEPVSPVEYATAFAATETCTWKCVIGNAKKWKEDVLTLFRTPETPDMGLEARLLSREGQTGVVEFRWTDGSPFSRVLEVCGTVPIPPYLNRESEKIDIERYQTLYAHIRGSVAAPTAGLHFTEDVLTRIKAKGIDTETVCLHVGAGTFLPVKSSLVSEHPMHREPFVVKLQLLKDICRMDRKLIAVGTTSVRTLESLYYVGVSCLEKGAPEDVAQWAPYEREYPYSTQEALEAIISYLEANNLTELKIGTRIIIVPGFRFRLVDLMVTNFHQPESTLILLVSAFVGGDWRTIYDYALSHGFRFLSYGDSSLLARA